MKYIDYLQSEGKTDNTIKSYLNALQQLEMYAENQNKRVEELQAIQLQDYKKQLMQRYSPSSVNNHLNGIRSFYKYLLELNIIPKDPSIKLRELKLPAIEKEKWLTEEEIKHLLIVVNEDYDKKNFKKVRNKLIVYLMLHAGLRISEVSNLLVSEVDIKNYQLLITNSKGGQYRTVPINKDLMLVLKEWLLIRPQHDSIKTLLVSQKKGSLTESAIENYFSTLKKYNLRITPHQLRHTFAKKLADNNVSIQQISTMLGHKNINTTRIYVTNSMSELLDSVQLLNREH